MQPAMRVEPRSCSAVLGPDRPALIEGSPSSYTRPVGRMIAVLGAAAVLCAGCGGSHTTVDTMGVKVTYQHTWLTSFARITGTGVTFTESAIARAEPQY